LDHLTHINPAMLANSLAAGYSQVIVANSGKQVFLAGQVGWDVNGALAGDGSFAAQAAKALDNVRIALEEAGASGEDIVHIKYFVVGCNEGRVSELSTAIREAAIFNFEHPPTGTLLGVECLARDNLLIEIEAIAVIPT
tara:strand:- start:2571 stop:2987 length:417 start_codon:yes stop_codon:yes gene_type:complete